jgi:hypothetical protein
MESFDKLILFFSFGLLAVVVVVEATTYYVDSIIMATSCNDYDPSRRVCSGGSATAFQTLQDGINNLVAGDILEVRSGTYEEQITDVSWPNAGTSWNNPIIIRGYSNDPRPVIRPGPHYGHTWLFDRDILRYLIISGLEIDGINNTFSEGNVMTIWSGTVRIENNIIRNGPRGGIGMPTYSGTNYNTATDAQIRNNYITRCGLATT